MKNVKKGRIILISAMSLIILLFLTVIVIGFNSSYNIKNNRVIKINKKFDLSKAKEYSLEGSGSTKFSQSWSESECSVLLKPIKTQEEKVQTALKAFFDTLHKEMPKNKITCSLHSVSILGFDSRRIWTCEDVIINYYPYGGEEIFITLL